MILNGKEEVCRYIPQRDPIVMVDKLYSNSPDESVTGLTIEPGTLFTQDGVLSDSALIEHTAQSGALHIGYDCVARGLKVPIGLIGSINKYKIARLPRVGEQIQTTISVQARVGDVTMVAVKVRVGEEVIAEGRLKLATPE